MFVASAKQLNKVVSSLFVLIDIIQIVSELSYCLMFVASANLLSKINWLKYIWNKQAVMTVLSMSSVYM